jgi:predicted N-acyltransferase
MVEKLNPCSGGIPISNSFDFQIAGSVTEIDSANWDVLSAGRPFASHQWYRYGEAVLADCEPTTLLVFQQQQPIARATFWRTANEPLPIQSTMLRRGLQALVARWPLLICRSPLSSLTGLVLPEPPLREAVQAAMSARASELLRQKKCSFLIFDYLSQEHCAGWPEAFVSASIADPGTAMALTWPSFEAYLEAGNKKDRQHYKRTLREAEKLGIQISRQTTVSDVDEALALIRGVEQRFGSTENPWARAMLERLEMVGGTFLEARIEGRLVGCGLVLQDNGAQMNATLGLAKDVAYVYFMLVYESLKLAFDDHMRLLRLGSGAYEVKEQLGFSREENNWLLLSAANPLVQKTGEWLGRLL